jgi:hypothetical protein
MKKFITTSVWGGGRESQNIFLKKEKEKFPSLDGENGAD